MRRQRYTARFAPSSGVEEKKATASRKRKIECIYRGPLLNSDEKTESVGKRKKFLTPDDADLSLTALEYVQNQQNGFKTPSNDTDSDSCSSDSDSDATSLAIFDEYACYIGDCKLGDILSTASQFKMPKWFVCADLDSDYSFVQKNRRLIRFPEPPFTFGAPVRPKRLLYEGPQSVVWACSLTQQPTSRPCVMKIGQSNRVLHEVSMYRTLQGCPGVGSVLWENAAGPKLHALVLDVLGVPLDSYGAYYDELNNGELLEIGQQLVRCLHAIHSKHVIHRDVKPANIIITTNPLRAWLCDFDVAILDSERPIAEFSGTPTFASKIARFGIQDKHQDFVSLCYSLFSVEKSFVWDLHQQPQMSEMLADSKIIPSLFRLWCAKYNVPADLLNNSQAAVAWMTKHTSFFV